MGLVPSTLRVPPQAVIRLREFTAASAMNPAAAKGSTSGHSAAKWCAFRIVSTAVRFYRASRANWSRARARAIWANPFPASAASRPGVRCSTRGSACASTQPQSMLLT